MAKKKSQSGNDDSTSFEASLNRLQEIVSLLENGNLTLTESLEKYELGIKNLHHCYQALEQAQKKIEILVDIDAEGKLITKPFDDRATSEPGRKTTRQADVVDWDDDSGFDGETEEYQDAREDDDIDDPNSLF